MTSFEDAFGDLRSILQREIFPEPPFGSLADIEIPSVPTSDFGACIREAFVGRALMEPYDRLDAALYALHALDMERAAAEVAPYVDAHLAHSTIPARPHAWLLSGPLRHLRPRQRRVFAASFPGLFLLSGELKELGDLSRWHPGVPIALSFEANNLTLQKTFASHPGVEAVRRVRLGGRLLGRNGELLASAPLLARASHLDMSRAFLDDRGASLVLGALDPSSLRALDLSDGARMCDAPALAGGLEAPSLTSLNVSRSSSRVGGSWAALAANPYLSNLRELGVGDASVREDALHAIATSPHLTRLRRLDLAGCWLETPRGGSILTCENTRDLHWLRLANASVKKPALSLLPRASFAPSLRALDLSGLSLQRWLVSALVATPFEDLRALSLSRASISDEQLARLVRAPWFAGLEYLDLTGLFRVGSAGLLAIAEAPFTRTWRHLSLERLRVDDDVFAALVSSPRAATLSTLYAGLSGLSSGALRVLAEAEHLGALELASFGVGASCAFSASPEEVAAFERAPHLAGCHLEGVHVIR